jgi:hypothetical protein
VIDPDASLGNKRVLSKFLISDKCTRQSRSFLLCKLDFFALSLANFRIPESSLRLALPVKFCAKQPSVSGFYVKII